VQGKQFLAVIFTAVLGFGHYDGSVPIFSSFFYYYLVCDAIGTAATPGLLCQPRVIVKMIVEKQMECRLTGETEVLGENLPRRHFCSSQNPTSPDPGFNPGRRGGKPATNRLSYGAAIFHLGFCPSIARDNTLAGSNITLIRYRNVTC
jgi:hypothetical protein